MIKSLYDQEAIFDQFCDMLRKESKDDGITIGEARGEARDIISMCREFGASYAETISKLAKNFACSASEAEEIYQNVTSSDNLVAAV